MKLYYCIVFLTISCVFIPLQAFSQENVTLSGIVTERSSNETLIGVSLYFPSVNKGIVTNEYGFYSITLPKGTYTVYASYLGLQEYRKEIELYEDTQLTIQLSEASEALEEVIITENIEKLNIRKPQMSVNALTAGTIKQIPVVLGEADVIKSILLLPGVTSGGEGAAGFNVRGGAADQNLILLDEATIFNSSHLFGFFSVFNPDAIKDIKLYKGGIPARYGGRVSSVLDIYQKEGNSKTVKVNGGLGLVSSRILAEGPIVKEKAAFLLGGRASYAHLFLPLFDNDNSAYFYDLNTKLNYKINPNNSVYLSGYFGRDVFSISDTFRNVYGNTVLNLRWNHLFSNKLFSNLSLIYSDYFYGLELDFVGFNWDSGIRNFNVKYDIKHYLTNTLQLRYGLSNIYYKFNPGEIKPDGSNSGIIRDKLIDKYANEFGVYIDTEHQINDHLSLQYGVRLSNFTRLGQEELNLYENDNPVVFNEALQLYESAPVLDVVRFDRSEQIRNFTTFEPRASLAYAFTEETSIKASYNRIAQYLHLLSNTNSPTPLDVWTPSGKYIEPQLLDQYAVGYFQSFKEEMYSLETELYYKEIQNRIDYIDNAELIANDAIERDILNGEARAYGMEVLLKKNEGKFKGWLAYTLSKSEQRTPGRTPDEIGINNGKWYNTPYDKTHDISFNGSYEVSPSWTFNANFLFQTGQPTNYPVGQFEFRGLVIPVYEGSRNSQRLPAYHRLDLSATLTPKKNKNRKWQREWVFSVYNVYNRKNAAAITFGENTESGTNEAIKTSIFGIVPAITYNFKF